MKKEKQLLLDEINAGIAGHGAFIITQYKKMPATKANLFRRELQKMGSHFEVVKKRLFVKVLEKEGTKLDLDALSGHVGLVFISGEAIDTLKAVLKFSDDNEGTFVFLGGKLDGAMLSGADMEMISKLPGRDQLRSEFLGLLEAPMAQTLSVIEQVLSSVVTCLDSKAAEGDK
jgi:large subunit ribosomal protein L10